MIVDIFAYRMKKVSLHEGHIYLPWSHITHTRSNLQNLPGLHIQKLQKWIKIHWNIAHSICMNINLPGLTRIGHNWHLLPRNKNGNQGKEGKLQERFHGGKRSCFFFSKKKNCSVSSLCKIKLHVVDPQSPAFCFFVSPAGVLLEDSLHVLGLPSLFASFGLGVP